MLSEARHHLANEMPELRAQYLNFVEQKMRLAVAN